VLYNYAGLNEPDGTYAEQPASTATYGE